MKDRSARAGQDELFAARDRRRQPGAFPPDVGEVRRETVKVVLPPDLEGVLVTLS